MPHPRRPHLSSDLFHHQRVFLSAVKREYGRTGVLQPEALLRHLSVLSPHLLSSFQEATLPQTPLFKKAPPLFLSAGFVALILLSGFPRHSQRYVFIASIEGCGCLSVSCLEVGNSEPGCLLQRAQLWTARYLVSPMPCLVPRRGVIRTCLASAAEAKFPQMFPHTPPVPTVERRQAGQLGSQGQPPGYIR